MILEHSRSKIPRPVRLATVPHMRGLPMTQDPKLNSHSKLNCILACITDEKAGADEALMLDVHGFVNTTNAYNFFIVRASVLMVKAFEVSIVCFQIAASLLGLRTFSSRS